MPTQLQAPGKSGAVSKRDQELKPRNDMLADVNLLQRPQVLGPEERDGSCEVSRSPTGTVLQNLRADTGSSILDSLCLRRSGFSCVEQSTGGRCFLIHGHCVLQRKLNWLKKDV